jgi:2-oxoglutarate dehydrogenase E2 component (dihydrolipoamide succinyltransferase)
MAHEIKVPALGESIVEATISRWLKQAGEPVAVGEVLLELETDKVNLEVAAEYGGVLLTVKKNEGDTVSIGEVLGEIGDGEAGAAPPDTPATTVAETPTAPEAPQQPVATAPATEATPATPDMPGNGAGTAVATPVAQTVAAEYRVDLRDISGSGPGGRVTKEDVLRHVGVEPAPAAKSAPPAEAPPKPAAPPPTAKPAPAAPARPAPPAASPAGARPEERIRMSRRRQTIARRLVEAQQTAAMLTTFNEVDMSAVMALRARRKEGFQQRHGINLGFMSFFIRAVIGALKAYPSVNAELQGEEMVLKHYYDIGVAVGVEEGLVVPVLRDADRKSFAALEREVADLAQRAREGTLGLADLQGGTFTITNGGVFGSLMSTPILNTPQVGILGMHKIEERPVVNAGAIVIRPMMYIALSYDHRLIDGSTSVRFLVKVKELIEDPEALLLEG